MSTPGGNVLLTSEKDQKIAIEFQEMLLRIGVSNFNDTYGTSYLVSGFGIMQSGSGAYTIAAVNPSITDAISATVVSLDTINLEFTTTLTPIQVQGNSSTSSTSFYPGEANPGGYGYDGSVS